jgi:membrane protein YqaA with SNARE-associated domain
MIANNGHVEVDNPPAVAWWHLHRRMYDWVLHWADTPYGAPALFCLSFAESSFFPVPPDVLLGPLVLGNRRKWLRFAVICSLASVLGGMAGYGIGRFAWDQLAGVFHDHVPGFSRDEIVLAGESEPRACLIENATVTLWPFLAPELTWPLEVAYPDGTRTTLTREAVVAERVQLHKYSRVITGYRDPRVGTVVVAVAGFTPIPYKVITITAGAAHIGFVVFVIASTLSRSARFFIVAGVFGVLGDRAKPFIDRYFNWLCLLFVVLLVGGFATFKYIL